MALNFYKFSGQITIKLKCGCLIKFNYYLGIDLRHKKNDIDFDGQVIAFDKCQRHKNVTIDNNALIRCLPCLCEDAKTHKVVPNTFTLFCEYDYVVIPFDLNRYFYLVEDEF